MDFKVEIADEVFEYSFNKKQIIIGANKDCDIFLDYESIGQQHLKIYEYKGLVLFDIITDEFQTYYGDKLLPKKQKYKFKSSIPLEIGGIFIYNKTKSPVKKEQNTSSKIQTPVQSGQDSEAAQGLEELAKLDDDLSQLEAAQISPSAEDLKSIFESSDESSNQGSDEENRKKYRPEIFSDSVGESSQSNFKLNKENSDIKKLKQERKSATTTKKSAGKKSKTRTRTRRSGSTRGSAVGSKFSLSTILVVSVLLVITGIIAYNNHYLPYIQKINATTNVETDKLNKKYRLISSEKEKIVSRMDDFKEYATSKKCNDELTGKICKSFGDNFFAGDMEGAVGINNKNIYIGFDRARIDKINDSLFLYSDSDKEKLLELFRKSYLDIMSEEEFIAQGSVLETSQFTFLKEKHLHAITLMNLIFRNKFEINDSIEKLTFFLFDKYGDEVEILDFFEITKDSYLVFGDKSEELLLKSKMFKNSNLTKDLEDTIKYLGETLDTNFDYSNIDKQYKDKVAQHIQKIIGEEKCASNIGQKICKKISALRSRTTFEGAQLLDEDLYIVHEKKSISKWIEENFKNEITHKLKSKMVRVLKQTDLSKEQQLEIIKSDGVYDLSRKSVLEHELLASYVLGGYKDDISDTEFKNLYLLLIDDNAGEPSILLYMKFSKNKAFSLFSGKVVESINYQMPLFKKRKMPIFIPYLGNSDEVIMFEEKQ